MAMVTFGKKAPPQRRRFTPDREAPEKVLQVENPGASRRGNSYYRQLRMCPREHGLSKVARLRIKGDHEALTQGFTFHLALEVYYRTIQAVQGDIPVPKGAEARERYFWDAVADAEKAAWDSIEPLRTAEDYEDTYADIERMLVSYFENYRRKDPWRIVAVEETLEYDHAGFAYSARLDLIVEMFDEHGKSRGLWIIEHKTARALTDDLIAGYQLDQQILGQVWLLQHCVDLSAYPPLMGVLVNLTSKHKTPQHVRVECLPSKHHIAAFEESIRAWVAVGGVFEQLGYPKALGNCAGPARYWSKCQFYDLCYGQPSLSVEDFAKQPPPMGFIRGDGQDEDVE